MDNTPTITPEVGEARLVNPPPTWYVVTVACLDKPKRSENWAINGMVSAALAEPEAIIKFRRL